MANIVLPRVDILDSIKESANILVEQDGSIKRFAVADLDVGGGDITVDLSNESIGASANNINADTLGGKFESELSVAKAVDSDTLGGKYESELSVAKAVNSDKFDGYSSEAWFNGIADYINEKVIYHKSRNLLPITANSQTVNGVTYTVNKDKSITINGTAGEDGSWFSLFDNSYSSFFVLKNSRIICDYELEPSCCIMMNSNEPLFGTVAINAKLTESDCTFFAPCYYVAPGVTINNITIHIMMLAPGDTDETYEPYYNGLAKSSMSRELLWENVGFSGGEFVSQEITLNSILDYDMLIFNCVYHANYPVFCHIISELTYPVFPDNDTIMYPIFLSSSEHGGQIERSCGILHSNAGEVTFIIGAGMTYEPGSSTPIEDNKVLIPFRIYGIKG